MSYSKLIKEWKKEHKLKKKEEQKQMQLEKEKQENFKIKLYAAQTRQEKQEEEQREKEREIYINESKSFLNYMSMNYPYQIYLIAWDIINNSYDQLQSDYKNNKITLEQIEEVYKMAKTKISKLDFNINYLILK